MPQQIPPDAQITYTTSPWLSPTFLGAIVTVLAMIASAAGIHVLDDQTVQQQLIVALGFVGTGIARYMWPQNDGRLSFSAPLSTPAPQNVPVGASVVTVPATRDQSQVTTVQPLDVGMQTISVGPAASNRGAGTPMTIEVTNQEGI